MVVGLEKVSEQYIEGSGSIGGGQTISGKQTVSGYYDGASGPMTPMGRAFPAKGALSGSGSLTGFGWLAGSASLRTRYKYETRFFLRQDNGVDRPFRFLGVEYMPILEGHTVSAVYCENDRGRPLLLALVNHNTRPAVLAHRTDDDIIDHLGIPRRRRLQRVLLSPEEHDRLMDEQQVERQVAREHHKRLLTRKRQTRERLTPWLLVACAVSFVTLGLGLLLHFGAKNKVAGLTLLAVGGVGLIAGSVAWACIYLDESSHAGRQPVRPSQPIETHETVTVSNDEEIDGELERIKDFIASVARSAASGRG